MITVHYLEHSRAHRILWLLEELDLAYEVKVYPRTSGFQAPRELARVHPLGKSPVIEDQGEVLAESGAIIDHLVSAHGGGRLYPDDPALQRRYRYWLHYAEGSAMPLVVMKLIFSRLPERVPLPLRFVAKSISRGVRSRLIDPDLRNHIAFWQQELTRDGYFAGPEFTAADIAMSFPLEACLAMSDGLGALDGLRPYVDRLRSRPAYQRALSRGGAYRFAGS